MTAPPAAAIEVRRLTYADLPEVVAIERRAFTSAWSLAMFVLELSKPSGICLAAVVDGELAGYLICSRYDTVWHVMNVAVDPSQRRRGIATALLNRVLERAGVAVPSDGSRAHRVSALMICRLGRAREPVDRDALLPDYRREPDAVPPTPPK